MYSHRFIRDNEQLLKEKLRLRGVDEGVIGEACKSIEILNGLKKEEQNLNEERNRLVGADARANAEKVKAIKVRLADIKNQIFDQEKLVFAAVSLLPNIPDSSLTDRCEEIKTWGVPRNALGLMHHSELCQRLDLFSIEDATVISGSGFVIYKNKGARLYRSLIEYTLRKNRDKGYEERYLPILLLPHSLYGTAQLPKFEEDLFRTTDGRYLSPTSESQLVNIYRDQIMDAAQLPIKLTANTNCFRKEAGAAGVEDAGIIRMHQFCKTELVVFCKEENSFDVLEEMVRDACDILESLGLPYRVLQLAYDDIGFSSAKTYDIEVWFPSEGRYREISSVSNTLDFQARRAKIRYKNNLFDKGEKARHPHILNGSSLAIDRLFAAIVDNYQRKDGSVQVPKDLVGYLGFEEIRD